MFSERTLKISIVASLTGVILILFLGTGAYNVKQKITQKIVIFSRATCFYCKKAKLYFQNKNLSFKEIAFDKNSKTDLALLETYAQRSKVRIGPYITVPQIFIGDHYIGGFTDLRKLSDKDLKSFLKP